MPHPPATIGQPFVSLEQVDSTNDEARRAIQEGRAAHGMTIFTSNQRAGRGQRGRPWTEQPGASLAMSIIIRPDFLTVLQQFHLSMAVSLAVLDGAMAKTGMQDLSIKWPNDLFCNHKKWGGILIESILGASGQWHWAIVGIGINLQQQRFDASLPHAISMAQITHRLFDPLEWAQQICDSLQLRLQQLQQGAIDALHREYLQRLYKKGERVQFKQAGRTISGILVTVDDTGQLILEGETTPFRSGELEWILPDPA